MESPSNPGLEVCDIAQMVRAAHAAGALVAVDNTTPTVLGQRPLALGADFSVASDTKALTGHSDLILGHVACGEVSWAEKLLAWRMQMGAVPGPMEVWLAHRSLCTAHLRQARQCANALAIAECLCAREDVLSVRYPGLPGDPSHDTAARQMECFGSVLNFVLRDRAHADRFLGACRLVMEATSFGSVHTMAERRARWGETPCRRASSGSARGARMWRTCWRTWNKPWTGPGTADAPAERLEFAGAGRGSTGQ